MRLLDLHGCDHGANCPSKNESAPIRTPVNGYCLLMHSLLAHADEVRVKGENPMTSYDHAITLDIRATMRG